jgi:hypothetical protein
MNQRLYDMILDGMVLEVNVSLKKKSYVYNKQLMLIRL